MNARVLAPISNTFFAIVAVNAATGQHSWLNISGVPLDVSADDFAKDQFDIEWVSSLPFAFLFNRQPMAELAWTHCENFFRQINQWPESVVSETLLTRNHGFVPESIQLMKYTVAENGNDIHGEVLKSIAIEVKAKQAA